MDTTDRHRSSSRDSHVRTSSYHTSGSMRDVVAQSIADFSYSHSSPRTAASSTERSFSVRRLRGTSRDIPVRIGGRNDSTIATQSRFDLSVEANVRNRIIQFQRNTAHAATRASFNLVTTTRPLVLLPSQTQPPIRNSSHALNGTVSQFNHDSGLLQRTGQRGSIQGIADANAIFAWERATDSRQHS